MPFSDWVNDPTRPGVLEEPFSYNDFAGRTYNEWFSGTGIVAGCESDWQDFMDLVNNKNHHSIRRLAISHWFTTEDVR